MYERVGTYIPVCYISSIHKRQSQEADLLCAHHEYIWNARKKVPLSSLEVNCQLVAPADLPSGKIQKGSKTGIDTIENRTEHNRRI